MKDFDPPCADAPDPEVFFPTWATFDLVEELREKYCSRCPHRYPCLTMAQKTRSTGIFGGVALVFGKIVRDPTLRKASASKRAPGIPMDPLTC